MKRRAFMLACAASALATPPVFASEAKPRYYSRARLVWGHGEPVRSRALPENVNFIFHYPYAGTPCFLLNLGRPTQPGADLKTAAEQSYHWSGGVGAARSVVAYSAICAHRLAYPTREISFISYRDQPTPASRFAHVIHCCSEHSQYDPAAGARVLAGPAPQPLATILLDYDPKTDELFAVGTLGGEMFEEFFRKYAFRLGLEFEGRAHAAITDRCTVEELSQYCRQQVQC